MTAADKPSIPILFQAIGTLAGQLTVDEQEDYRLETPDGVSLTMFVRGRMIKLIRAKPELLGEVRPWTVYPKTGRLGKLSYVHLIGMGAQPNRQVEEFHISGRVVPAQAEGLIGVRIQPNRPSKLLSAGGDRAVAGNPFQPFYINLRAICRGMSMARSGGSFVSGRAPAWK